MTASLRRGQWQVGMTDFFRRHCAIPKVNQLTASFSLEGASSALSLALPRKTVKWARGIQPHFKHYSSILRVWTGSAHQDERLAS